MGPMSAPAGSRVTPQGARGHEKCQDRERCAGPGCRVRTGKTYHKRTGTPSARAQAELARFHATSRTEDQETAA